MPTSLSAHQVLEKLAIAPVSTSAFPTHFNVIIALRTAMNDRQAPVKKMAHILMAEPVVAAKVLQSANAATHYGHTRVMDIDQAIFRLGSSAVRRIALGVAMAQLVRAKELLIFSDLSRQIWLHSLYCAAAADVITATLTPFTRDEALISGLMVDLGAFYLLYLAATHKETHGARDDVLSAVKKHYSRLSMNVLRYLQLPPEITDSVDLDPLAGRVLKTSPKTLTEVVYAAKIFANDRYPWAEHESALACLTPIYTELQEAIDLQFEKIKQEYRA